MSTTYPTTTVRNEPGIDVDLPTPILVALYAVLWVGFTLGGAIVALMMAEFVDGVAGGVLFLTVGLGFVAAGPTVARRTMMSVLDWYETYA